MTTKPAKKPVAATNTADSKVPETSPKSPSAVVPNTKFELIIAWPQIQAAEEKALKMFTAEAEISGFRKGKAPEKLVKEKINPQKLTEAALEIVLPHAYAEAIQAHHLHPITQPHINPKAMADGKDWEFEVEIAEAPQVELGDYKKVVKDAKPSPKLWTPGSDPKQEKKTPEDERGEHLQAILKALLEKLQVQIPELLVREEVNASLSRMVAQLEKLRIGLDDYLKSTGKTADELRQEYAGSALASLQLEFILAKISSEEKIVVEPKEIDDVIQTIPDPEMRKHQDSPAGRRSVESTLLRRKVLDFLLAL